MSSEMLMFERDGTSPTFSAGGGGSAAAGGGPAGAAGDSAGGGGSDPHATRTKEVAIARGSVCIENSWGS
jgi:hypothetical protein